MDPQSVCISYALDDAPEAAQIASIVRNAGWDVCFVHVVEPSREGHERNASLIGEAACTIVVWSSNASISTILRADFQQADRAAKLILAVLDDAATPTPATTFTSVIDWRNGGAHAGGQILIDAITRHAGARRKRAGRIVSDSAQPKYSAGLAISFGVLLASCAVLAVNLLIPGQKDEPPLAAQQLSEQHGGTLKPQLRPSIGSASPRSDIDVGQGARSLERQAGWEEAAWQGVIARDDLLLQLEDLVNFRIDFPRGRYAALAGRLEEEQQEVLLIVRENLTRLGYLIDNITVDDDKLRGAFASFERSVGLAPSGRLTESSIAALNIAADLSTSATASTTLEKAP